MNHKFYHYYFKLVKIEIDHFKKLLELYFSQTRKNISNYQQRTEETNLLKVSGKDLFLDGDDSF